MTNPIREEIDEYYNKMQELIDPVTFELQNSYKFYNDKILKLQKKCKHHFIKGKCEYCDLEESK